MSRPSPSDASPGVPNDLGVPGDAMPPLVWMATSSGEVTYYNERYREYSGIAPTADGGWTWSPVVHPDDAEATMAAWARATQAVEPYEFEHRLGMADGTYRWHISRALPMDVGGTGEVVWFGTATDTHAQKQVEEALRESEQRFRTLADSAPVMIRVTDPDGSCTYLNRSWYELTGQDDPAALGAGWLAALHPEDRPRVASALRRGDARPLSPVTLEYRLMRADGAHRWVLDVAAPRFGADGSFLGHLGTVMDITDRKRIEEATQLARSRAETLSEIVTELEAIEGVAARARRLVEMLVPHLARAAIVDLAGLDEPVVAVAHRDAAAGTALEAEVRDRPRASDPIALWRARTAGEPGGRLVAPLRFGRGTVGALVVHVDDADHGGSMTGVRGHLAFLRDVAARAELLLSAAELREREHTVAVRLQRALLPGRQVVHPQLEIATRYVAAAASLEVGGDWFETFEVADGRVGLVVGDVVGHNIDAAAAMGQLRSGLLALAARTSAPAELLADLHTFARRHHITDFATACCAVLDPATGELQHASAGHLPMLVVAHDGSATWLTEGRSAPIGIACDVQRPGAVDRLEPGSVLVACSDGLVERRGVPLDSGLAALRQLVRDHRHRSVEDICSRVIDGLVGGAAEDDVVLLAVRYRGPAAEPAPVPIS